VQDLDLGIEAAHVRVDLTLVVAPPDDREAGLVGQLVWICGHGRHRTVEQRAVSGCPLCVVLFVTQSGGVAAGPS
jgi:hypothetical protein